jgi:hypothetical protein
MIGCILVIWSGMFFLKSMEKEESIFDEYYSGEGIVIENSGDKHYIFDLDDYGEVNPYDDYYKLKVSMNVKLYSVDLHEMMSNRNFNFGENELREAKWSDFNEGDLVYYFSEDYSNTELIKGLVLVKQDEVSLEDGDYKSHFEDGMMLNARQSNVMMSWGQNYMLNWEEGQNFVNDDKKVSPEEYYDVSKPIKFKYLMNTDNVEVVSSIYITEYSPNIMKSAEYEGTAYFKEIVSEDGINKLIYNLENGGIKQLVISENTEQFTEKRIKNDEYSYGEKIVIYKNIFNEVVSIKPFGENVIKENMVVMDIVSSRFGFDKDIRTLNGIDENGDDVELILDTNISRDYGRWEYKHSLAEVGIIDDNYIVDFEQCLGEKGSVNIYRLLAVESDRVELGFNNLEDANGKDFDSEERVWIDLSDGYKWIGEKTIENSIGRTISVKLDQDNRVKYMLEIDDRYLLGYYDSKSPLRSDENQESSMMMSVVRIADFEDIRDVRFRKLKFRVTGIDINENTKYYEYNYDLNYLRAHLAEWENFWNQDFSNVNGVIGKELKYMDLEEGDICAVTYNGEIGANFVKVVKLIPSTNSIVEGEIKEDRFVLKTGEEIELRETSEIITEGEKHRLVHSYLEENEANVRAWPLLDEKGWARYIIVIN